MRLATHRSGFFPVAAVTLLSAMSVTTAAEPSEDAVTSARAAVAGLTPKDAGARYGQALGAVEICTGAKVTDKASALNSVYSGSDLDTFKAQATKIYDAWLKVKHCVRQDDPNQCKVIMDESCAAAIAEIGPSGTAVPGLLDAPPR